MTATHFRVRGLPVFVEASGGVPLVEVSIRLRVGSLADPTGEEGLARLTARALRSGPRGLGEKKFEENLARLGARLSASATRGSIRFHAVVLARNVERLFALLGRTLLEPAFRRRAFQRSQRETLSRLIAQLDDDDALATRHLHAMAFGEHPYGRPVAGHAASVRSLTVAKAEAFWTTHLRRGDLAVGLAGDIDAARARTLVENHLGDVPAGTSRARHGKAPRALRGRRLRILDKPERTQTPMIFGTRGARFDDPHLDAWTVADTIFGGTFASRLNRVLRTERGYTYGAGSHLGRAARPDLWTMHSAPEREHTLASLRTHLELLEEWVDEGVRAEELDAAQRYLIGSFAFETETASRRLDLRLERFCARRPPEAYVQFPARVRAVTLRAANEALRVRMDPSKLAIVLVASPGEDAALIEGLESIPGLSHHEIMAYDAPSFTGGA